MSGLSGSGKSTAAQQLANASGAIRLRSDAVRKHLAGVPLHEKAGNEVYTSKMTDKTYSRLINLGTQLAGQGYRVILDAKFDKAAKRQEAIKTAGEKAISLTFLHCTAPAEVLIARVTARAGDIADADAAVLAKQSMEPFESNAVVITLDTTSSADEIQQQLGGVFK